MNHSNSGKKNKKRTYYIPDTTNFTNIVVNRIPINPKKAKGSHEKNASLVLNGDFEFHMLRLSLNNAVWEFRKYISRRNMVIVIKYISFFAHN